ncbi:MAG: MFS transporter [Gemmataceae bacterium]|nr:MFS transporter [Gemmataceae bacterium]
MHGFETTTPTEESADTSGQPWWRMLNRYHWFVLVVAALGWLFDTMDQQLFNLARVPAIRELMTRDGQQPAAELVAEYAGYSTSIFLIGWASGGIAFGIMGDRIGRAKTMLLTILVYSIFTGLSALSVGFWDFAAYRFLTGLGVGGEFAVGVSLVAEVMPFRARPFALGLLQALSAVGNVTAALISIVLGHLEETGAVGSAWRIMFVIGTLPALLAILIRRNLKEPETWTQAAAAAGGAQLGSISELFGNPRWRKRAIIGLLLASSGIIGLWGIGFFSIDLNRSVFRKSFEQEARERGEAKKDHEFVRSFIRAQNLAPAAGLVVPDSKVQPEELLGNQPDLNDNSLVFKTALALIGEKQQATPQAIQAAILKKLPVAAERLSESNYFPSEFVPPDGWTIQSDVDRVKEVGPQIKARAKEINGRLTLWAGITSMMLNLGAFFGIYAFTYVTSYTGRKPAFAISFILAMLSTAMVFWYLKSLDEIFWMIPLMGFCQLALFGGYAIYFPELFPTRLRSTGISFCYNVGRFVAALGPSALGLLTSRVFKDYPEPMRYAGVTMCSIFLLGLIVLPFAPETKGQPLPE